MARRPQAPVLLAGARAATQAAAPAARGRVVLARATTTIGLRPAVTAQRSLRQSARIEQGDTTGRPSGRVAQRPQATPARAAAKPSTPPATRSAANHRRRAG
jgi:hypothetical protein